MIHALTSPSPQMVIFTLKCDAACMASKRHKSLPSTNSFATLPHTDTNQHHVLPACGITLQDRPRSPCALTILASNIFPKKMHTTWLMRSKTTTESSWILLVPCNMDSPWTGTTPRVMLTYPCLATSSLPYKNLVIPSQNVHSTLLTNGLSQSTAQLNNGNQPPSPPLNPIQKWHLRIIELSQPLHLCCPQQDRIQAFQS